MNGVVHDEYKKLEPKADWIKLEPCPVCCTEASLWQYSESPSSPRQLVVCCDNGDAIGPQNGLANAGCLLYMPPEQFYQPTMKAAVEYWNQFAKALTALREKENE